MKREEVINQIKERQGQKSLREFARELGVSPAYLSDVFLGRRDPGPKILGQFSIQKKQSVLQYEKVAFARKQQGRENEQQRLDQRR